MITYPITFEEVDESVSSAYIDTLEEGFYVLKLKSTQERLHIEEKVNVWGETEKVAVSKEETKIKTRFMQVNKAMCGNVAIIDGHFSYDYGQDRIIGICKLKIY